MRHDEDTAPGDSGWRGRAAGWLSRNRLLAGYLLAAVIVKSAGSVLAAVAFDGNYQALFAIADVLNWATYVIVIIGFAHWADQRVRAEQAHTRAMRAAIDAAGIQLPDETAVRRRHG